MNDNEQNPYLQNQQSNNINNQQQAPASNDYGQQYQVYNQYSAPQDYSNTGKGMGVASLVLSIVSLVCCCAGTPCAVLGLIFGIIARKNNPQNNMALAGIIISILGLVWSIGSLVWALVTGTLNFYVSPTGTPFIDPYDTYNWM